MTAWAKGKTSGENGMRAKKRNIKSQKNNSTPTTY